MYVEHLYGKHRSKLSLQELEEGIALTFDAFDLEAPELEQQVLGDQGFVLIRELLARYGWLFNSRCESVQLPLVTRQEVRVAETVAKVIPDCSVVHSQAGSSLMIGSHTGSESPTPATEKPTYAAFMFLETMTADIGGRDVRRLKATKELMLRLEQKVRLQNQVDEDDRAIDNHFHAQQRREFFDQFKKPKQKKRRSRNTRRSDPASQERPFIRWGMRRKHRRNPFS